MRSRSVAIIALTAVTASGCGVSLHFADYRYSKTIADEHIAGPVTELDVKAGDGHVVVTKGTGDGVTVHRVVRYQSGDPRPGQQLTNGTLTFSSGCSRCRIDYDLTVPASVRVHARTDGGRINVADVASVDVASDSGSIRLRDIAGDVRAGSDSGSISVEGVASGEFHASTDSGSIHATGLATKTVASSSDSGGIRLEFTTVPSDVNVSADSGSLHLKVPDAEYHVKVATDSGGRHVHVRTSESSPYMLTLHTDSGSVNVDPAG